VVQFDSGRFAMPEKRVNFAKTNEYDMKTNNETYKFVVYKIKRGDSKESVLDFLNEKNLDESEKKLILNQAYSQIKEDEAKEKKESGFWTDTAEEKAERAKNREMIYQQAQKKKQDLFEELKLSQNLTAAISSGLIVSVFVAVIWALVSVLTGFQHSAFGLLVGLIVGKTMFRFGKGVDLIFGILGAVISIWACLLGNTFTIMGFVSNKLGISILESFSSLYGELFWLLIKDSLSPWDIFLYCIAAYIGFQTSRVTVSAID
jgi:hypothetical protein